MFVLDEKITPAFFELYPEVYKDILSHYKSYGVVPEKGVIASAYPKFVFTQSTEPIAFFVDQLKKRRKTNILKEGLTEAVSALKTDIDDVETVMYRTLQKSKREIKTGFDLDIRSSGDSRKEDYLNKKKFLGVDGYSSGWDYLDNLTCGFHGGDFTVFIAKPKIGKSWLLINQAHTVWQQERVPVLYLTREMHPEAIRKRFDAMHCQLPYNDLRKGLLSPHQEAQYFQYLEDIKNDDIPFVVLGYSLEDGGATVSSIIPKVERYLGDGGMLFVDGIYLMEDDRGESDWRGIVNIAKDLKNLGQQYNIPVSATSQATIDGKGDIPNMENIAYGKYIAQFVDVLGSYSRSPEDRIADMAWVHILAQREGDIGSFAINFEFDPLNFEQKLSKTVESDYEDDEYNI